MNDQQENLEQRVAALERRLKVSQFMSIVFGGLLGFLLVWSISHQIRGGKDIDDRVWVRNAADEIVVEMSAAKRSGQLSVNNHDRKKLFNASLYENEDIGMVVSVSRPDGSKPAVALHGREDGGEIIVWRGQGERTSLWGGGVDADGEPVSVVERLVQDVAELKRENGQGTE